MATEIDTWRGRLDDDRKRAYDAMEKRAAAEGWTERIQGFNDVLAMAHGCHFDAGLAEHVAEFFPRFLRHSKDPFAGQPFELQGWQRERVIAPVFGWQRPNGTRRFRVAYLEIPKKQGKTTLAAGLGVYMLAADGENGAEVYPGAINREQAGMCFEDAARMVEASPILRERIQVIRSTKTLNYSAANGRFKALSADVASHEGLNVSCAILDELHAHKNRRLWDTLRYGGSARSQPLFIVITTAGDYDPTSIGWETHEYAENVIAGTYEDWQFYALIYAASKDADWADPATWYNANPSLGITVPEEDMQAMCDEALNSPDKQSSFKRYRLNIWVQTKDGFIDMDAWNASGEAFDLEDLADRPCYGGLDLSSKEDLSAFALAFPPTPDDQVFRLLQWLWVPEDSLAERAKRNGQPYIQWVNDRHILTTPGARIDYRAIRQHIEEIAGGVKLRELHYDPKFAAEIIADLEAAGVPMVEHAQTCKAMNPGMQALNLNAKRGELKHNANPAMSWQMGNVIAKYDTDGAARPDKSNRKKKIDGPVAAFMALGRAVSINASAGVSKYETEDLRFV